MRRYCGKYRNETVQQSSCELIEDKKFMLSICILDMNWKLNEHSTSVSSHSSSNIALNVISFRQFLIALEYCNVVQNQFSWISFDAIFLGALSFGDPFSRSLYTLRNSLVFFFEQNYRRSRFFSQPKENLNSLFIVHLIFNGHTLW